MHSLAILPSILPLLALSRPVDWKPDPGECALCPVALHRPWDDSVAWEDKFTNEHGLCSNEEGYAYPSFEYLNRCNRKLGAFPPGSIAEPPYGDFVAPLSHHDPNLGFGTNVPNEARRACEVVGPKYGLLDRKCLRKWLDDQEEEAAKRLEPCDPEMMKSCCRNNGTIDRVCWLKAYPKQQRAEREKQMFDDIFDRVTNPEHAAASRKRHSAAEIQRRQLLPFPDSPDPDGCGNWTVAPDINLPIPADICKELMEDFRYVLPAIAPLLRPHIPYTQKPDDLNAPSTIARRHANNQPAPSARHHCGTWTDTSGARHAIPAAICRELQEEDPRQCGTWTDSSGVERPIPATTCWWLGFDREMDEPVDEGDGRLRRRSDPLALREDVEILSRGGGPGSATADVAAGDVSTDEVVSMLSGPGGVGGVGLGSARGVEDADMEPASGDGREDGTGRA